MSKVSPIGYLSLSNGHGTRTLELTFVVRTEEGKIRNYPQYRAFGSEATIDLSDLALRSYFNSENQPYSPDLTYRNVFSVDAARADSMAKTLKSIERKLNALDTELGYVGTFAECAMRLCKVLGAKTFIVSQNSASDWDNAIVHEHNTGRMASVVELLLRK